MTVLWIVLALFLIGALLFLLPPLLAPGPAAVNSGGANLAVHRDHLREVEQDLAAGLLSPETLEQARAETRARVIEDAVPATAAAPALAQPARTTALVLAVLVPLGSMLAYLVLGSPQLATPPQMPPPQAAQANNGPEQIQQRIAALNERLKAEPTNAEGWLTLGRLYTALSRFGDATAAFRRANELTPGNATLLADLADLSAMTQGKRLAGEPARYIQLALDADPRHPKALALAGSVSFEVRDFAAARGYWERLLAVLPPQSEMVRSVQTNIAEATRLAAGAPEPAAPVPAAPVAAAGNASVSGRVTLSPELVARLPPGATLFVFARAAQGPRMPLAILRRPADGKPFDFSLDETRAMQPQLKISGFPEVVIGARISVSGNAMPQPGDLIGQSAPVKPGSAGVQVRIDAIQPAAAGS